MIEAILNDNRALASDAATLIFLFQSGIIQGCTAAGLLFGISCDPLVRILHDTVDVGAGGTTRVCADDIGMALPSLSTLKIIKPIFRTKDQKMRRNRLSDI